jgi:hypothetical protein
MAHLNQSHADKGELHGITIVVDTTGPKIYVGRCWEETEAGVVLLDADAHEEGADGLSKEQFVQRTAKVGQWARIKQIDVPRAEVASIRRLGEVAV